MANQSQAESLQKMISPFMLQSVKENVAKEEAEEIKAKITEAGGSVELK